MHLYTRITCICLIFILIFCALFWNLPSHTSLIRKDVEKTLKHNLAIIVPFRNRFDQLLFFLPYMEQFIRNQSVKHDFYIINQADEFRFNRASLINAGVLESDPSYDYIAIHDIDLLPKNHQIHYSFPDDRPLHLSPPSLHPIYHYKKYMGGILLLTRNQFFRVNGMSNLFWGWGREDDEFRLRLLEKNLVPRVPIGITSGNQTFMHFHPRNIRRDQKNYYNQKILTYRRDFNTGLNNLAYKVDRRYHITINSVPATVINVKLICDETVTPYCRPPL